MIAHMFKTFRLIVLLFAGAIMFAPMAVAQSNTTEDVTPSGPIAAETDTSRNDAAILKRIRSLYSELEEFKDVFVTVHNGVVTLKGKVLENERTLEAEQLAARVEGVASIRNQIKVETSVEKRLAPALERFQERAQSIVAMLPLLAVAFLVFCIISLIGFVITRFRNPWDAITPNRFVANLFRQIVRIGFVLLGLVVALDLVGAAALLGTIVGAAGILGLAIGFAVRDTVENYISSIMLSFRQPFRPEDFVQIGDQEGYVMALTSRATILMSLTGNHIRIPNATVFKSTIVNYSRNPQLRFSFTLGVETEDLHGAVEMGLQEISALPFILSDPAPNGWIEDIGDSSTILWFGGWIDQRFTSLKKARSEAILRVKARFDLESVGLPEPIYRLRFDEFSSVEFNNTKPAGKRKKPTGGLAKSSANRIEHITDVEADHEIQDQISEARSNTNQTNLLDPNAPHEMG